MPGGRRREDLAQERRELGPLRVGAAEADLGGEALEAREGRDLEPELARSLRAAVAWSTDLLLGGLELVVGRLVEVLDVLGIELGDVRWPSSSGLGDLAAALARARLAEAASRGARAGGA